MRIGLDCRIFGSSFTGLGRYASELTRNFIELNNKLAHPHTLVFFLNNPEYREFKPSSPFVQKVLCNIKHYSFKEQLVFPFILYRQKLDLMFFPHFNAPLFYRKKFIVTIHDLILSFFPGQKMTRWFHRLAYYLTIRHALKKSRKLIAVSQNTKSDILKLFNISPGKIEVIYNGVSDNFHFLSDLSVPKKTLKKYNINKDFLLYTGVWRSHKNLVNLIRAFKVLKDGQFSGQSSSQPFPQSSSQPSSQTPPQPSISPLNLQLVLAGKPDRYYPEVLETIKKLELANDVVLPGFVSEKELNHLYNAALFFIFPSLYEGFGLSPLESMRAGSPVIASYASSIPEICGEENAVYFDPQSPQDIARKIFFPYKNPDFQTKLIENGIKHSQKFTWKASAKKTWELLIKN